MPSSSSAVPSSGGSSGAPGSWCDLPGSVRFTASGKVVVPGAHTAEMMFLTLPQGFCAHYFGHVGNARHLRFAPGGELFVASPTTLTTGGGPGGRSAIMVLPDDDHDGYGDSEVQFQGSLPSTQGFFFSNGWFYFQDHTRIMRVPYAAGDRTATTTATQVADVTIHFDALHWPKPIDIADDGTIYVGNGGGQGDACVTPHPFLGGMLKLDGTPGGTPVARGFRNPITITCARGHNRCFALELAKDYAFQGGREKMVPINDGDDLGFPCCASRNLPYTDINPVPDCSMVTDDTASFLIGDTPTGLDFAPDTWPAPYAGNALVALHGAAGSWLHAKMVAIGMDATTGLPLPATNISGQSTGAMRDFASGWDDGTLSHGRPVSVAFNSDGRMFVANDTNGNIFWVAPIP
jgi:glucose/arabinose dehydrogenase